MIDVAQLTPIEEIGDEELRAMWAEAREYLLGFEWCDRISPSLGGEYCGLGIGGIVAVFYVEIVPAEPHIDSWLWVVVGDLPSAYLVTDNAPTPGDALGVYCELMQDWVDAVRAGDDLDEVFPVAAAPTQDHAAMLESRINLIRDEILPAVS